MMSPLWWWIEYMLSLMHPCSYSIRYFSYTTHWVHDIKDLVNSFLWCVFIFRELYHLSDHLVDGVHNGFHLFPGDVAIMIAVIEMEWPCRERKREREKGNKLNPLTQHHFQSTTMYAQWPQQKEPVPRVQYFHSIDPLHWGWKIEFLKACCYGNRTFFGQCYWYIRDKRREYLCTFVSTHCQSFW